MSARSQKEKEIREAYCFLRENNTTIPSDILDFMLDASLKKLDEFYPIEPKEKDFFEDFTTLRWVKWTKRQPNWNGTVYIRWHSKYTSSGTVWDGYLMKLDGEETRTKYTVIKGTNKIKVKYTANQKRLIEEMYWLEEIHDLVGYNKYEDKLTEEFLNKKE